tara:strand:- start:1640 stop:2344 length:705 start_codon:yes stop_codon:yes gene_type:complete
MATTTIYADSSRGAVYNSGSDWEGVTTATSGSSVTTSASQVYAVRGALVSGRGGSIYHDVRTFAYFDTSAITTNITAATLKVHGNGSSGDGGTMYLYKGDAFGGAGGSDSLDTDDYDEWTNTTYSADSYSYLSWDNGGLNDFTINSTGITAMNNNSELNTAFLSYQTIQGDEPTQSTAALGINFYTSGSNRLKLVITHADPAQGYTNEVISVAAASISDVVGIETDEIEEVIGV